MGIFFTIILIAIAIAAIFVLYIGLSRLLCKFPALIWIVSIAGGVVIGICTHWIVGIIAFFLLCGLMSMIQSSTGQKCAHCGSYNTKRVSKDVEVWKCNDCGGVTGFW